MREACQLARQHGTLIGAHPSYDDEHFGRVSMDVTLTTLGHALFQQCRALAKVAGALTHMKPHGALYHDADRRPDLARFVVGSARIALSDVAIVGPPGGELQRAAETRGLEFLPEGFADRGYQADGQLIPRGQPGALITEPSEAAEQARRLLPLVGIAPSASTPIRPTPSTSPEP